MDSRVEIAENCTLSPQESRTSQIQIQVWTKITGYIELCTVRIGILCYGLSTFSLTSSLINVVVGETVDIGKHGPAGLTFWTFGDIGDIKKDTAIRTNNNHVDTLHHAIIRHMKDHQGGNRRASIKFTLYSCG